MDWNMMPGPAEAGDRCEVPLPLSPVGNGSAWQSFQQSQPHATFPCLRTLGVAGTGGEVKDRHPPHVCRGGCVSLAFVRTELGLAWVSIWLLLLRGSVLPTCRHWFLPSATPPH